jgi:hypothetical protein
MGLDIYIDKVKEPVIVNGVRTYKQREEMCYWRKFYELLGNLPFKCDEETMKNCFIEEPLTKDQADKILTFICHNRDYFDSFDTVVPMCELIEQWDELVKDGWKFEFNANW